MVRYECSCGRSIETLVELDKPPTCERVEVDPADNKPKPTHRIRQMTLVGRSKTPNTNPNTEGTKPTMTKNPTTKSLSSLLPGGTEKAPKAPKIPANACTCYSEQAPGREGVFRSCGRLTNSRFAPGHDAKLKGQLIRAALAGEPLRVLDPGSEKVRNIDPFEYAEQLGWSHIIDKARESAQAKADKAAARAATRAAVKAAAPKRVSFKIGRWPFEGDVVKTKGDTLTVKYVKKDGTVTTAEIKAEAATPVAA